MFPIVAVVSVLGSAFSIAKGAAWVVEQLDSGKPAKQPDNSTEAQPVKGASAASFEAALAAQVARQKSPTPPAAVGSVPSIRHADYEALARMQATILGHNNAGQPHHAKQQHPADDGQTVRA